MSLELCRVVLIETHYPGNIGATARVMANFGLSDLVLVSPVADPNDRNARQLSARGESVLTSARVVRDLSDAINDCVLVVGTTGKLGGLYRQQNVGTPRDIMSHVVETLTQERPAALVFGSEPNGLPNEIVTRCHYLIHIPTAAQYASLNLAQAVAICLYELRMCDWKARGEVLRTPGIQGIPEVRSTSPLGLALLDAQEHMFEQLQAALAEIHFVYGDKAEPLMHAVRHLLGKARLTEMEVKVLLGLARQIRWYVANHQKIIDGA